MSRIRISPPRPGLNARHGDKYKHPGETIPTIYVASVRVKKEPRVYVPDPRPIWAAFHDRGEMADLRAAWVRWEMRKGMQREKSVKGAA